MAKMSALDWTAIVLLLAGGLNWGLYGFLGFNLVAWLAAQTGYQIIEKVVYGLVALAALYSIYTLYAKLK